MALSIARKLAEFAAKLSLPIPVSLGGTGKTSMGAGAVGAVTQAAGVATGAIVETGSNANGTYIKWADGTMLCRHMMDGTSQAVTSAVGSMYQSGAEVTWTYPVAFVGAPTPNVTAVRNDGTVILGAYTRIVSNANLQWRLWCSSSLAAGNAKDVHLVVIGRWY